LLKSSIIETDQWCSSNVAIEDAVVLASYGPKLFLEIVHVLPDQVVQFSYILVVIYHEQA